MIRTLSWDMELEIQIPLTVKGLHFLLPGQMSRGVARCERQMAH